MTEERRRGDRSGEGSGDRCPAQSQHEPDRREILVRDALTRLDLEWPSFARSGSAASSLQRWRASGTAKATSMADMLAAMRDDADPEARDRLLYRFAVLSCSDRVAARLVLQVVRPGLGSIVQQYWPRWGWDVTASMAVAAAFERIVTYPGDRRDRPAANIVRDVQNRLHRVKAREEALELKLGERACADQLLTVPVADRAGASDELIDVVNDALATGRLTRGEADLVVRCRILDEAPQDLAAERDRVPSTVRFQRRRAEERLALITRSLHGISPAVA
jgi:hypothetical protein